MTQQQDVDLSSAGKAALRQIRALRKLPKLEVTIAAEKKILKQLNTVDVLAIALILDIEEKQTKSEVSNG